MHDHRRPARPGPLDQEWYALAARLAEISRDLQAQDSAQATADRVADHAVALIPDCDAAGIAVRRGPSVTTLAATDYAVRVADRLQAEQGDGPCHTPTTSLADPWPRWAAAARAVGIGSVMRMPLRNATNSKLGTPVLYSAEPRAFTEHAERIAGLCAEHAAVALAGARVATEPERALLTSRSIGQAIGILMALQGLTSTAAFELLRTRSQETNIKLRDLAEEVVETGEIPIRRRRRL